MSDKYYPKDNDSQNIEQGETRRYFLFHKPEEEDCYKGSNYLNMFLFLYEWNVEGNFCEDKRALAKVINFLPCLCLKLPRYSCDSHNDGNDIRQTVYIETDYELIWDDNSVEHLYYQIRKKLNQDDKCRGLRAPVGYEFNFFKEIYFYSPESDKPYMYLFFRSNEDKRAFKNKLRFPIFISNKIGYAKLEIHEEKINTLMRFMSKNELEYNVWFSCTTKKVPWGSQYRVGNENVNEYYVDYETIKRVKPEICANWFPVVRICAYDFETYSYRGTKRFPEGNEIRDPIFLISVDFKIMGREETRKKYCLVLGETEGITSAEVIHYTREQDLIVGFMHLLRYIDADYYMGHNNYGFDNPYIIAKFDLHYISEEFIPNYGRLLNYKTKIYSQKWKSSGYGQNSTTFICAPGTINIDTLPTMKRLHKLRKYSLEFLSNKFLNSGKNNVTVEEMFDAYRSYLEKSEGYIEKMTRIAKYCIQDSKLVIDLYESQKIFYHLLALSGEGRLPIEDICIGGEQRRCYSQLANLCYNEGFILQNSIYFDYYYSGGFVGKPIPKVFKFVFTPDFTSLYPSLMQAYNLCYKTFIPIEMWPEIPRHKCNIIEIKQMEPKEHFSLSRKKDIEDKLRLREKGYDVKITQEEEEYVERIIQIFKAKEEAETEEILDEDEKDEGDKPKKKYKEEELTERTYEMRFAKKEVTEGLMPKLQRNWVASRKKVKDEIKQANKQLADDKKILKALENRDFNFFEDEKNKLISKFVNIFEDERLNEEENKERKAKYELLVREYIQNIEEGEKIIEKLETENEINDIAEKLIDLQEEVEFINTQILIIEDNEKLIKRKKELEKEINQLMVDLVVKDKKQNAIKVVANSGYGFTGVRRGMLVGIFIAMCVTYMGRKHINEANDVFINGQILSEEEFNYYKAILDENISILNQTILEKYEETSIYKILFRDDIKTLTKEEKARKNLAEHLQVVLFGFKFLDAIIVYNDTDSSMVSLDINLTYNFKLIGSMMEIVISGQKEKKIFDNGIIKIVIPKIKAVFPEPLKMEFEDVTQMVPIKPKFYLKALRETDKDKIAKNGEFVLDDKGNPLVKKKGVLTAKRGNSVFSMEVYQKLADNVLFMKSCGQSLKELAQQIKKLLSGGYEARKLAKITELGSDYKEENYFMNVFSNNLKKWGKPIRPGDRIEYIIVKTKREIEEKIEEKIGMKCREIEMWEQDENREQLDYQYYAEKGLQKQYDDLFLVGYSKIIADPLFKKLGYKPNFSRCHFVHFGTPIKMIAAMIKDFMRSSDSEFNEYLEDNYDISYKPKKRTKYEYIGRIIYAEILSIVEEIEKYYDENGNKIIEEDDGDEENKEDIEKLIDQMMEEDEEIEE